VKVRITLHGFVRERCQLDELTVDVLDGITVGELRDYIQDVLINSGNAGDNLSLNACALGTDKRILLRSEVVPRDTPLAILPPVNGG
jgi:molybdopterin converting factor small subunit